MRGISEDSAQLPSSLEAARGVGRDSRAVRLLSLPSLLAAKPLSCGSRERSPANFLHANLVSDLANKITGCPVKFEFQKNKEQFLVSACPMRSWVVQEELSDPSVIMKEHESR